LYFNQKSFIYFPPSFNPVAKQEVLKSGNTQEVSIDLGATVLKGFYVGNNSDKIIIYFGGNGEDITYTTLDFQSNLKGVDFIAFNYPNYAESQGELSQDEIYKNAQLIYNFVQKIYPNRKLFIMGRSLGSGVANYLARENSNSGVILVTPYDSILNLSKKIFWFIPVSALLTEKFESEKFVNNANQYLILYAGGDQVVGNDSTENLTTKIRPTQLATIKFKNTDHNNISNLPEYWQSIRQFVNH
jgi:alpha/beta superfamily hydrolase